LTGVDTVVFQIFFKYIRRKTVSSKLYSRTYNLHFYINVLILSSVIKGEIEKKERERERVGGGEGERKGEIEKRSIVQ
jgi:hypothetical protein